MKAITFDRIGAPAEVLQLSELPVPAIRDNEVLVRMVAASINPGDFLFIGDLYPPPKKPVFPGQIAGNHGAGIIEMAGKFVSIKPGSFVAFSYYATWAEYAVIPAEWLIELPLDYPIELASQFVNLITAWDLLHQSGVKAGDWLALTAGNSTVSNMAIRFARQMDVNIIAIVGHAKKTSEPDVSVIGLSTLQGNIRTPIMELTDNAGVNAIIDNVGGPVTGDLIRSSAFGGRLIINGGMSAEKFELHNFDVLMNGMEIKSHVYRYFFTPPKREDVIILGEIIENSSRPDFQTTTGGLHALEDFKNAIDESVRHPEEGKRIFRM
jgi:NADPH:quinone reductase